MRIIMITGEKDSGKTSICAELIGIRKKFYNRYPRKFKNKIAGVVVNEKNCVIVSEGDDERCIKNVRTYLKEAEQDLVNSCNKNIDYLIVTVRSKSPDLVNFAKKELFEFDSQPIEIKTTKSTDEDFSISKEYWNKGKEIKSNIN
ncbi:hypothetical protein [Enterococcus rotai]|uniref:hypothetical protein n=1 Tax=Enterococcus rotai TaxID=118060 RepID=UPI0035C70CC7